MDGRRVLLGVAVGILLAGSVVLLSLATAGMTAGTLSGASGEATSTATQIVTASTTTTIINHGTGSVPSSATSSTTTGPANANAAQGSQFSLGGIANSLSGSASLANLSTQPLPLDLVVLLPLALAVLAGSAAYRMSRTRDED